jgi:hypothetical protein
MTAIFPTLAAPAPVRSRKHLTVASLLAFLTLGLMAAFPSHALDLVAFVGIGGPLAAALGQLAALAPGVKALVGFVGSSWPSSASPPCATSGRSCSTSAWPSSAPWA